MVRTLGNNRGIALVMVIWMLVILVVLAAELTVSAKSDVSAVRNFKEDRQAYFIAKAGVEMAFKEMLADSDYHYYLNGQLVFARHGDEASPPEFAPRDGIALGGGLLSYAIRDGNEKLSLNALAHNDGQLRLLFQILFPKGAKDGETAVDSIQDWVDADELHRANGAESDYYETLDPPYRAKNGDFDTMGELRKVKGISPEIYAALDNVVTAYPVSRLNPNTASETALVAEGMPPEKAAALVKERASKGYVDTNAKSDLFIITATGTFKGSKLTHTIRASVKKTGARSLAVLDWTDDHYQAETADEGKGRGEQLAVPTP